MVCIVCPAAIAQIIPRIVVMPLACLPLRAMQVTRCLGCTSPVLVS
ncbi:MAG: hypothetical protein O8C63_00015 [Candidatus Methanoperedens sp.]|nr:hypothetical protein [Candidatus Methanoperedens sp.]